jgi:ribosome-associated toxin RatA of RatAB toxin-antitoxin module
MNSRDKFLIFIYVTIGIILVVSLLYIDLEQRELYPDIMNSTKIIGLPQPLEKISSQKIVDIPLEIIFDTMTDVEKYPLILPRNVISINVIDKTPNSLTASESLADRGIKTELTSRHSFEPYSSHTIEILNGDAKGTTIIQKFSTQENSTIIDTEINFKLTGALVFVKFIPESNLNHALNTILDSFINYTIIFDSEEKRIVDNLYREILFRAADEIGLDYYSVKIASGEITPEELRQTLLDSDEKSQLIDYLETKTVNDLKSETKDIINKIYLQFLGRNSDQIGMEYYGSLLESKKITVSEIEQLLFNSDESLRIRLNSDDKRQLDAIYFEILGKHMSNSELDYHSYQVEENDMTMGEFKEIIKNPNYEYNCERKVISFTETIYICDP